MNSFDYAGGNDRQDKEIAGEEIFTVPVKAGKRIYYFDVKTTRADDYYVTITESRKKLNRDGSTTIDKHKIHLYKEDFEKFAEGLSQVVDFVKAAKPETKEHRYEPREADDSYGSDNDRPYGQNAQQTPAIGDSYGEFVETDALMSDLNHKVPTEDEFFAGL